MYEEGVIIETAQTQLEIIELEPQEALKQHEPTRTIESSEIEKCSLPIKIVGEKWDD